MVGPFPSQKQSEDLLFFLEELLLRRGGKTMDLWIDGNEPR